MAFLVGTGYVRAVRTAIFSVLSIALLTAACDDKPRTDSGATPESSAKPAPAKAAPKAKASAGAATAKSAKAPPKKASGPPDKLNVILFSIDALRNDMPWNGYEREIAPVMTKLAKENVVYTRYRSVSSYTAQTVACFMTGQYASTLYRNGVFFTGWHKDNVWITEVMQEKGIRTMGTQAHMYFGRGKNIDQGFDIWEIVPGITFNSSTDEHVTSPKTLAKLKEHLGDEKNTKGQFFYWTHWMDPHDQYIKHEESPDFGKKNRDRYDNEVHYTDMHIGKFIEWAKTKPWWKNTALIITSDHGEVFGEHDMYKHAFELWEPLVKVPLIVVAPGATSRRIDARRTHIDLAPTIVELMGLEKLEQFQGKSLVPELYGAEPEDREPVVMELSADSHNPPRRAIVKGDYKLLVNGEGWKKQLFNIKKDPEESKDLSKSEKDKFEEMDKLFDETYAKIPRIRPYGGNKLKGGQKANGPMGRKNDPRLKVAKAAEK